MNGAGPQPLAYTFSRLCEEFPGRLPSEIHAEIERLPDGFLFDVIEMRAYAGTKRAYDVSEKQQDESLLDLVKEIEAELVQEEINERRRREEAADGRHDDQR